MVYRWHSRTRGKFLDKVTAKRDLISESTSADEGFN